MSRLLDVSERLKQRLTTIDGRRFYGYIWISQLRNLPDTSFVYPRRFLRVSKNAQVGITDVIRTPGGDHYLVAEHGTEEFGGDVVSKQFRLFKVDKQISWKRKATVVDPVTGLAKQIGDTLLGTIWCALAPIRMEEDSIHIAKRVYRLITGAQIQVDDIVDNRLVVRNVETLLGVSIAEVA